MPGRTALRPTGGYQLLDACLIKCSLGASALLCRCQRCSGLTSKTNSGQSCPAKDCGGQSPMNVRLRSMARQHCTMKILRATWRGNSGRRHTRVALHLCSSSGRCAVGSYQHALQGSGCNQIMFSTTTHYPTLVATGAAVCAPQSQPLTSQAFRS
jgi:hypothetical protein